LSALVQVRDLKVWYEGPRGPVRALDGVSFAIERGETYAILGESGCGKSTLALSLMKLQEPGRIVGGEILFDGRDLVPLSERQMRPYRGARIGIVFQEPGAALNPVLRIGTQVGEALRIHRGMTRREAWNEAVRLLEKVALPDPERQARAYPHELSGGMKQRVMLAIALSCSPELLIADEPTTALDVTIQAQILALLRRLKEELRLTVLLVAHDLGVVAENADRVGVLYAGKLVEEAPVGDLFEEAKHPYTRALLRSSLRSGASHKGQGGRRKLPVLPGSVPDPASPPPGCRFHPRCPDRFEPCDELEPEPLVVGAGRRVACFLHDPERGGRRVPAPGKASS
jgi:oligopeptide/dipeptide ABC transporter ATP-binding protein